MLVPGIADSNEAADRPYIVTRGRIAVAILNYTETTNGIPMPAEHPYCVNSLYRSNFAADVSRAREAVPTSSSLALTGGLSMSTSQMRCNDVSPLV